MILTEKFEVHDTLNPKLWGKDNKLLDDVKVKIVEIIEQFLSTCEIPISVVDAHLVGSNASYNYTNHSDLDIHIISNFELIDAPKEILQIAYNAIKTKFNSDYDISIRGVDVEIYVEDIKSTTLSNGIYSIYKDEWLKFPKKLTDIPHVDISDDFSKWESRIQDVLQGQNSTDIESTINDLYLIRKHSLDTDGEYGKGNQLFKEVRNVGLLDKLKTAYKASRSKELTLEHFKLLEDSRTKLISRSKQSDKGFQRFKRRVKSRVANTVKQYNSIDMNKLFKQDILTVDINVKGETDDYEVKISYGGFLELLHDQLKKTNIFDLKAVTRALVNGFNRDDVYIHCSCPDWKYRYAYYATKNQINSGDAENRPSNITNPKDSLGVGCKHVLLVLSNTSWILKVASTIFNYVNYMEKHYQRLYADIIYPAIYQKDYEEPVQMSLLDTDDDTMETDKGTLDASNKYAIDKTKFQKGNTKGIRFAPKDNTQQLSFDDEIDTEE